ncbi:MAG TPA: hypothetical protein VLT33_27000, partial [Labilithrix sp.]|nr:hypothetical protein [Labilithrix sp.]
MGRRTGCFVAAFLIGSSALVGRAARAEGPTLDHDAVDGANLDVMDLVAPGGKSESIAFTELGLPRAVGTYSLRLTVTGEELRIPPCNGRGAVTVDGALRDKGSKGPLRLHLGGDALHDVRIDVAVSPYEKRIACGERVRVGTAARSSEGLTLLRFPSPHTGPAAGEAVLFVPRGHDAKKPGPLLVGVHPWNGGPWTYAA